METSPRSNQIFITGIAGQFPNSKNVEELYHNLNEKKQLCSLVDPKWKIFDPELPPLVGIQPLNGEFDAGYFGVHYKHAEEMHHACRKLLELSVEAVMDSGLNPSDLKGSKTGVFVTSCEIESRNEWSMRQLMPPNFSVFGVSNSLLAAQISYHLQLQGPSVAVDGTCSGSVYLLHHAIKSIQSGRCDNALVCGLNAVRNPNVISGYNQLGVLSLDESLNVFDESCIGYVKSETTTVIFLQKLQESKRVYAEILNIGTNCDGFKEVGIMYPSFEMMADVFQSAYDEIGVDPSTVAFVECHVTGTQVGIVEEIKAVEKVFCAERITPLPIGSIKANIGHCEPASGLVSIIKILLGCQYNCILPNPQYYHLKLDVDAFRNGKVVVLTHPISLPNDQDVIIGCNNSGFGGTNGHIVLKHHSATRLHSKQSYQKRLICFSARTMSSLSKICNSISVGVTEGYISLLQNIFKQNVLNHWYRGYIIISDCTLSEQSLQCCNEKKNLCLLYPPGTKRWLSVFLRIKENSRASESFEKIRNILRVKEVDVLKLMSSKSDEDVILATVTLQLVVTDVLEDVIQDQIIFVDGFSSGIIAAAYAKKILQLEDALTIAFQLRKRLLNTKNLQVNLTKSLLFFCATVRKSPVISRPRNLATKIERLVIDPQTHARALKNCNRVFKIKYNKSSSTVNAPGVEMRNLKLTYIKKRLEKNPVLETYKFVPFKTELSLENSVRVLIQLVIENLVRSLKVVEVVDSYTKNDQIQLLCPIIEKALKNEYRVKSTLSIFSNESYKDLNIDVVKKNLEHLYTSGLDFDLDKFYPNVNWPIKAPFISPLIRWKHDYNWPVFNYDLTHLNKLIVTIGLDHKDWKFLSGHVIDGRILFPATAYLVIAWNCYLKLNHLVKEETKIVFENVKFHRMTILSSQKSLTLLVNFLNVQNKFEVSEDSECLATGTIRSIEHVSDYITKPLKTSKKTMCSKDIYKKLNLHGYNYKKEFCCLQEADLDGTTGLIKWNNWTTFLDGILHFTLIAKELDHLYVPSGIEYLVIDPQTHAQALNICNHVLPIYYNESLSTVRAPGVELRKFHISYIKKRLEKNPVLETYKFVPFKTKLSLENSLTVLIQMVIENSVGCLKVIEVIDSFTNNDQNQLLCPIIEKALKIECRVKSTLSIFSNKSYEDLNIDVVNKNLSQLPNDVNLVILSNGSKRPKVISDILQNRNNCFVLSRETNDFDALCDVVSVYQTNQESLVMLRKSCSVERKILNVGTDLNWLKQLQSLLTDNEKVLLVSQNDTTSGVLGLNNCLKQEVGDDVACMFLPNNNSKFDVNDKFFEKQLRNNLLVNVFKDDQWGSYKHLPFDVSPKKCFHVICVANGIDLSHMEYVEGPITSSNKTLIDVKYVGVNFRDVMVATAKINLPGLNEYRSELSSLGFEFSGMDWREQKVMGITSTNAFSNFISADKAITCPVPKDWSLEDAATVPATYLTVLYALLKTCRLDTSRSVLIHSGTGGVGLSAVNICLHFNCKYLSQLVPMKNAIISKLYSHIGNSRDTTFEQMILKQTGGEGVDIIINSLSEDKLQASTRCLSRRGIFVELGKFDSQLDNPLPFDTFCGGRAFVGIHLDTLLDKAPSEIKNIIFMLKRGLKDGYVKPLPRIVFAKEKVHDALRYMSVGKHTGKILLNFKNEFENVRVPMLAKPRFFCDEMKVYIIVGGLGGFGIELADWLIGRGAKQIILVSRNGPTNGYQNFKLNYWRKLGHKVLVSQDDLTTKNGCVHLLKKANALGVIDEVTFNTVLTSKVLIVKNLDETSRAHCPDLRQFVVFSSYVSGRGNSGQTNYGMANSGAERICEERKSEGYPALAIQWGLIGDVGLVAEKMASTENVDGLLKQKISSCLKVLDLFLTRDEVIVSSTVFDDAIHNKTSKFEEFLDNIVKILAITNINHVSIHEPLSTLGMDSMSTLQLKQFLDTEHNMYFTPRELRNINLHM
ncbi:hypothetical protein FQR65_LT10377 [Abscondita terminalis]|nr:hypothetical protein FQR65_LT10377 [Abscondita terminalis]